ncbi:SRPBCC family protein [Sphaerisporangium album]|uniref:SRPBCC family protein n=1 Tax=Sphaerisporangium album TaxID=509200 RepID=A0A367F0X2_9ACTN|nr:SRPBCC family protein [Sphaerisporangium album]RCG24028.1 SRPBCC family protein [Sphaerisporangium album]
MEDYGVTGARVDLEVTVDLPREKLWELITSVPRIGDWSPECRFGNWLDGDAAPKAGTRFQARNRRQDMEWTVTCQVTEVEPPQTFAWEVLDPKGDPDAPSSRWRYELTPGESPDQTVVRHSFEHGAGHSGIRDMIAMNPDRASVILNGRLGELRAHMVETLDAMTRDHIPAPQH